MSRCMSRLYQEPRCREIVPRTLRSAPVSVDGGDVMQAPDADPEVMQQAIANRIDPAVHGDGLSAPPGTLHDGGVANVGDLLDHVQLTQALKPLRLVRDRFQHRSEEHT